MHDIDRTQRELEMEAEHEHEAHEHEAHEHEHEGEAFLGQLFGEAEAAHESHEAESHEHESHEHESHEAESHEHETLEAESPLNEAQEMELASELLEVSNEAELEYFFGKLARTVVRGAKRFIRSPQGRMLGSMLKGFAKKALPIAGTAVGSFFGGPLGGKIGGGLGNLASGLFELELEGLSHEDREFEVARQIARMGAAALNAAARAPRNAAPGTIARRAFRAAARVYAPGLFRRRPHCRICAARGQGRMSYRPRGLPSGPSYVRRSNGTRVIPGIPRASYVEPGQVVSGEPMSVEPGQAGASGEPSQGTADAEPGWSSSYPTASRGGRWFRRGRHIVLTGL
jgi:hypothetical protein